MNSIGHSILYKRYSDWGVKKSIVFDFLLVFALVCLSGNMVFLADGRDVISLSAFAFIIAFLMFTRSSTINKNFLIVLAAFVVVFAGQTVSFSFFPPVTIAGFFVKLFIAYGVMCLVSNFPKAYVRVMILVSILSLLFYIPDRLSNIVDIDFRHIVLPISEFLNVQTSGVNERINIGVYNFQTGDHASRNAAFFWEPGAFAGYLVLAIIFLSICRQELSIRVFKFTLFLFVVSLLTTQSTMGIVVFPFALLLFLNLKSSTFKSAANSLILVLLVATSLVLFSIAASKVDFVGDKIVRLYSMGVNQEAGWHSSRFGAMIFDAAYIQAHPLTGWGQNLETQFQLNEDMARFALGNGMTGFVRQMGLLGMGVFILSVWLGLRRCGQSKGRSLFIIFIILLVLNGEYFLLYPLFMSLMFLAPPKNGRGLPALRRTYA